MSNIEDIDLEIEPTPIPLKTDRTYDGNMTECRGHNSIQNEGIQSARLQYLSSVKPQILQMVSSRAQTQMTDNQHILKDYQPIEESEGRDLIAHRFKKYQERTTSVHKYQNGNEID